MRETLKAFIRGKIISSTAHINKLRIARQKESEASIAKIDEQLSSTQSPSLHKEKITLKIELDLLLTREAEQLLLHSRGSIYEHRDKAGCLLAHQLKAKLMSNQILQIRDDTGSISSDPKIINNILKSFYSQLYTSELSNNGFSLKSFFEKLTLPKTRHQDRLDAPLKHSEIKEVIQRMQRVEIHWTRQFPL